MVLELILRLSLAINKPAVAEVPSDAHKQIALCIWTTYMSVLERHLAQPRSAIVIARPISRDVVSAADFFQRLTGIDLGAEPTTLGMLVTDDKLESGIPRLKLWYAAHGRELVYEEGSGGVRAGTSAQLSSI